MSKKDILRIPDYLEHIVEAIERIHRYVEDLSEVDFLDDEKTQDAVVRNFEIIGEAARNIERYHLAYAQSHPEIPWIFMYAMLTVLPTAISKWILNWFGKPSTPICRNCMNKFGNCLPRRIDLLWTFTASDFFKIL